MKNLMTCLFLMLAFTSVIAAQESAPDSRSPRDELSTERRPNLLRELGLSAEQVQQIRKINQERRPQMEAALTRLREANRSLDEAIYSDTLNESDVNVRMKEVQAAQSELARLRFTNELAVRKVLSPEQLIKFRELRRQFAEQRQQFRDGRRQRRRGLPLRRLNRQTKPNGN